MQIQFFTLKELVRSRKAVQLKIDNTPTWDVVENLSYLTYNILDPLRRLYGKPIFVTSGYRCTQLNKAVGGVATSQHITGQAADIIGQVKGDNKVLFNLLKDDPRFMFDQLISEQNFSWVHVSYSKTRARRQVIYR